MKITRAIQIFTSFLNIFFKITVRKMIFFFFFKFMHISCAFFFFVHFQLCVINQTCEIFGKIIRDYCSRFGFHFSSISITFHKTTVLLILLPVHFIGFIRRTQLMRLANVIKQTNSETKKKRKKCSSRLFFFFLQIFHFEKWKIP